MKINKLELRILRITDKVLQWLPNDGTMPITRKLFGRIRWYLKLRLYGISDKADLLCKILDLDKFRDGGDIEIISPRQRLKQFEFDVKYNSRLYDLSPPILYVPRHYIGKLEI